MRVMNHNWSATKQRLHPQSVAEISRHSVLSGDRIRDIVSVSPQGHRSVSVSRHFLLQAPQCPCSVQKRLSRDHCCRGRSKPGDNGRLAILSVTLNTTAFWTCIQDNPGKPAPELSETSTKYTTLTVLKFLKALPTFPSRPPSLPLGSNTKENLGKQLKETWRTQGQEPTLPLYSPNSGFDATKIKLTTFLTSLHLISYSLHNFLVLQEPKQELGHYLLILWFFPVLKPVWC